MINVTSKTTRRRLQEEPKTETLMFVLVVTSAMSSTTDTDFEDLLPVPQEDFVNALNDDIISLFYEELGVVVEAVVDMSLTRFDVIDDPNKPPLVLPFERWTDIDYYDKILNLTSMVVGQSCQEDPKCVHVMEAIDPVLPPSTRANIDTPGTCQYFARTWLYQLNKNIYHYPTHRIRQRYAMAVFFCEMDGSNWARKGYWIDAFRHECDWQVVAPGMDVCGRQQQIQILRIYDRLAGTLPPELSMITSLWELSIGESFIGGTIPNDYAKLSELDSLQLPSNLLRGEIPDFIWKYEDMVFMDLAYNLFDSTIPSNLPLTEPNLRTLMLSNNALHGSLPIDFGTLDWKILHLDGNHFEGPLPPDLFQGKSRFEELDLHSNDFSGEIPPGIGDMNKMSELRIQDNRFLTGDINDMCKNFDTGLLKVADVDKANVACECCGTGDNFRRLAAAPDHGSFGINRADLPHFNKEELSALDKLSVDHSLPSSSSGFLSDAPLLKTGGDPSEENGMSDIDSVDDFFGDFAGLNLDSVKTTHLDDYKTESCDWSEVLQPHVIRQCQCQGNITILADDIVDLQKTMKIYLLAGIYKDLGGFPDVPITSCDPRNQALIWLASGDNRNAGDLFQRYVLATLYFQWSGPNWDDNSNWLSQEEECLWKGVHCEGGRITQLELDSLNVAGTIPREIVLLRSLSTLSVSQNSIEGTIPKYVFSLMPRLRYLRLDVNRLKGSIPTEVGMARNLEVLLLGGNRMTGPLPASLGQLTNLDFFGIEFNGFVRALPSELGQLRKLRYLDVSNNRISGTIPSQIGGCTSLERWLLTDNLMTGSVPSEVGLMASLRELRMEDIGMHGPIPTGLGLLKELRKLDIRDNHFSGTIPSELGALANLEYMALIKNDLTGTLPSEFGQLAKLTRLDLYQLHLSGTLPVELGQLSLLEDFAMDQNDVISTIPNEICELREKRLEKFIVDCPTKQGRGVGNYSKVGIEVLLKMDGNCFTICRRGA